MAVGDLNKRFGWTWLTLAVVFGFFLEIKLGEKDPAKLGTWLSSYTRETWRAAHAHATLLAVVNLLYAKYLEGAVLSDSMKNWGSRLIVVAAILAPAGLILLGLGIPADPTKTPPVLNLLGALSSIAALGIMAYGHK